MSTTINKTSKTVEIKGTKIVMDYNTRLILNKLENLGWTIKFIIQ